MAAERRRILLDVDGVLADFAGALVDFVNLSRINPITRKSLTEWDLLKAAGASDQQEAFDRLASRPGFCGTLAVCPGAQAFVKSLQEFAEVVIVTAPYENAARWTHERLHWLKEHFAIDKRDVVFAKRKSLVAGDLLIDDALHNVGRNHYARSILIDQPWNQEPKDAKRYYMRADSLDHALALARHSFGVLASEG
jgi:5'(3')-deoxyribonucleotidase